MSRPVVRRLAAVTVPFLLAVSLAACSDGDSNGDSNGDSGRDSDRSSSGGRDGRGSGLFGGDSARNAPTDASKDDFCGAYNDESTFGDIDTEASAEEQAGQFKDALQKITDKLKDVGTPEDIPDDAREGFEIYVDAVSDLDEDDIQQAIEDDDFDDLGEVSEDDEKKGDAFTEWAEDYCA